MAQHSRLRGSKGEYLVALQFVLFFGFIFAPAWNPLPGNDLLNTLEPLRWIALVLLLGIAFLLGVSGLAQIRKFLTPLPYPVEHNELVQHGAYAWVRHPLYSSQLFAALGWVLFTLSLSHLLILVVAFLFFDFKARREERWLSERHPHYADYAKRVRKFVPGLY